MNLSKESGDAVRKWGNNEFPPIEQLWPAIEGRFGVLPSFFRLARSEPPIAWMLFRMAEFAYQDNPLPSLFKEQLFTYLSRFCEIRYCIARHCAFLMGDGYVSGDPTSPFLTADEVLALLKEPLPSEAELPGLLTEFVLLPPLAEGEWPDFSSHLGYLLRIACASVFLQPSKATAWLAGMKRLTGDARYEQLMLLLAFIRMAHFWTHVHPELAFEEDLDSLLREHAFLMEPLLNSSEALAWGMGEQLAHELEGLRANRAEFRLASIIESSEDAIVSKDVNGTILTWNGGAERIFGYSAAEVIGKSIRLIIPADRQDEEDEVLKKIRQGEKVNHFETVRVRKDGSLVDISVAVSPIKNAEGVVIGASKVARDITDRKLAERANQESAVLKDQFLSLVSHELRTPIATIVGNGMLLLRRGEMLNADDKLQALTDVVSEGERLQRIIENLLVLSRVDATRDLRAEPIHLSKLVAEEIEAFKRRSQRPISMTLEPDFPIALGEEALILQVVENLLGNADKYSRKDEDAIEVILGRNQAGWPEVRVLDRGIGINSQDQQQLFAPFYRSDAAMRVASGMGLGLAVCKRIIEAQGGEMVAQPREGGGAEFSFSLPPAD